MQAVRNSMPKLKAKPAVVANGYGGFGWPKGNCESVPVSDSPCASLYEDAQLFRNETSGGFVDGWIFEGFYGHNVLPARCSCQHAAQCGDLAYNSVSVWKKAVAFAAQANPPRPVFLIIAQAGCKSSSLEDQPSAVRDKFETAGYGSFLLAVQEPERPVTLGINNMHRESRTAEPYG